MNKKKNLTRLLVLAAVVAVELSLCGCGSPRRPGLVTISGIVTFDGSPLEEGFIMFESIDASHPPESAPIKLGKYEAFVWPGKAIVRIIASRQVSEQNSTSANPPAWEDFVPARYNERSELTAEIESQGRNEMNFDLLSKL